MTGYEEQEKGVSILIVEDNPDHATLAKAAFAGLDGWDIEVASSLKEAFAVTCKKSFDVVLLDYILPDGSGFDLLDWLKRDSAVIMMTGQGSEQIAVESFRSGVMDYVVKDCLFRHNLLIAVEQIVNSRKTTEIGHLN